MDPTPTEERRMRKTAVGSVRSRNRRIRIVQNHLTFRLDRREPGMAGSRAGAREGADGNAANVSGCGYFEDVKYDFEERTGECWRSDFRQLPSGFPAE